MVLLANSPGRSIGLSLGKVGSPAKGESTAFVVPTEFANSISNGTENRRKKSPPADLPGFLTSMTGFRPEWRFLSP